MTDLPQRHKPRKFVQYWRIRINDNDFTYNKFATREEARSTAKTYKRNGYNKIEVVECYENKETHTIDHYGEIEVI